MSIADPLVMPIGQELLACLDQEMSRVASPPKYVAFRAGNVVAHLLSMGEDECCEGLAWVRPASFYPSSRTFPAQDDTPVGKAVAFSWGVTFELGAIRCAPSPDADRIPTSAEWEATTQAVMDDAAAMRRALCCFRELNPRRLLLPGAWSPIDVQGGCVGGIMTVTVRGPACDCSEAGSTS